MQKTRPDIFLFPVFLLYLGWAFSFLLSTTYLDPSGDRHFVLFDDAMISMRYAFNLASGHGLVWNIDERVEGYTNPLWTLYMSALIGTCGKYLAPLLMQVTGLILIIGAALFAYLSAKELTYGLANRKQLAGTVVVIGFLGYYPLSYWSLTGMEVSLLSFTLTAGCFFTIKFFNEIESKYLNLLLTCIFLAYFTRPDGWIPFIPLLTLSVYRGLDRVAFSCIAKSAAFAITGMILVALHLVWRWKYYGSLVPNTYVLKVQGHSLGMRLENGFSFATPFLYSISIPLILAVFSLFFAKKEHRSLYIALFSIPLVSIAYQIFVGGDPWPYWRQMAPTVFLLTLISVSSFLSRWPKVSQKKTIVGLFVLFFIYGFLVLPNKSFKDEALLKAIPYQYGKNINHTKEGLALSRVMTSNASIMSFWAGAIPYFSSSYAIDPLGKTDSHIANLPPDPGVAWGGMKGVPGHDKHDLSYSIIEKSPDYIQAWKWFGEDLSAFVHDHYVAAEYQGIKICLKRGSKFVYWDRVNILGDCELHTASSL